MLDLSRRCLPSPPADLDVLLVYEDRSTVMRLREMGPWDGCSSPIDLIAMTPLEVTEYDFVAATGAVRLA